MAGRCIFDLGGRSLTVQRTFQTGGLGAAFVVRNAGDITVTSTGKLKARGDFVQPNGVIVDGGTVRLFAAGSIAHAGVIDVSGDPGGLVEMVAGGDVALEARSLVQGDGITSFVDDGMRFSDGGDLEIRSAAGGVALDGDVSVVGGTGGTGGYVTVLSALDVSVGRQIDASGGAGDGGVIVLASGDSIAVHANLNVQSRNGGGFGGDILIEAGLESLGGAVAGGSLVLQGVTLQVSGSSADGFGGDGGQVDLVAAGPVTFTGAGSAIRANAGTQFDGYGGWVSIDARDPDPAAIGPLDGDVVFDAPVHASSGNDGGFGGLVELLAAGDLTIGASMDLPGRDGGGELYALSGGAMAVNGHVVAPATSATGNPGTVALLAGTAEHAPLTVAANVLAPGGSKNASLGRVELAGCALTVAPNVRIDGRGGVVNGVRGGSEVRLVSRAPMQLGAGSQFLAHPGGTIHTVHPPGQHPIIGAGVVFNPARIDVATSAGLPPCGLP